MTTIDISGRIVGYELKGSGPSVVFCHSLGASREMFRHQFEDLADDHRVLMFDMRGHGESSLGEASPSLDRLAQDVEELLDVLDIGYAHLVGQSIGGMTVLQYAVRQPYRRATYLVADAIAATWPEWDVKYTRRAELVENGELRTLARDIALASIGQPAQERDPSLVDTYAATLGDAKPGGYAWACRSMIDFDLFADLRNVDGPLLAVAGSCDTLTTPAHARGIAEAARHGLTQEIDGSGHVPCLEQPAVFTELIRSWIAANPIDSP